MTDKKIVVLIDDIDRLQGESEVHQIFKLVKLSAKFENTIFVLSFDPDIINSFFNDEASIDSAFLDKIVQAPIHLPAIEQARIDRYLFYSYPNEGHYSAIDRLFQKLEIGQDRTMAFDKDFTYLYQTQLRRLFPTLRKAKRYLNGLYQRLPSVKNEVNLQDFLILEVIRVFYHEVYEDIWLQPWYYLPSWGEQWLFNPIALMRDENEKYQKIKEHVSNLLQNYPQREVLQELLEKMFFEVENAFAQGGRTKHGDTASTYRSKKWITHPDVFSKYFTLMVPISDISDEAVEALISTWNNSEPTSFESRFIEDLKKFQKEGKLVKLLEKLMVFLPKVTPSTAKMMIGAIYMNINLFSKEGSRIFSKSEYDKAEILMLYLINERIDGNQIKQLLVQVIRETPSFALAVTIVLSCRRERGGRLFNIYENIDIGSLHRTLSERLTKYFIDGGRDIFEEEPNLYSLILYQWGAYNQEDKHRVNEYVFSLVDKNPKRLGGLIKGFVTRWDKSREEIRYEELVKLYDENRLYEKIKNNYTDAYANQEERNAVDLFISTYKARSTSALQATRQQAEKQQYRDTMGKGYRDYSSKNFAAALVHFDEALKTADLRTNGGNSEEAKLMKWRCLLELAWNNGEQYNKESFEEACKIAGNEAQSNILIESHYKDHPYPDRGPIELYYCLFYCLQWIFSEEREKPAIKDNFMMHYTLAISEGISGRSDDLVERCKVFLEKISNSKEEKQIP